MSYCSVVALAKERCYVEGRHAPISLSINSALLKSSCCCNERMQRAFCSSSVDKVFYLE